jgi:hypothetical protein
MSVLTIEGGGRGRGGGGRGGVRGGEGGRFFKCDARLEWNGKSGAKRKLIENRYPGP